MAVQARPSMAVGLRPLLPLVLITAAGMALSLTLQDGLPGLLAAALVPVVLAIAAMDARRFIIPDELTALAALLGLAYAGATGWTAGEGLALAVLRGAVLALLFWAIRVGYRRLRGRDGLGLGDVKLAFAAGVWLDWTGIPIAVDLACGAALLGYVLRQRMTGRPLRRGGRLPFGLFFAPAVWIGWCLQFWLPMP